ncbi:MAG: response regulator [Anaerolineae bacterium]
MSSTIPIRVLIVTSDAVLRYLLQRVASYYDYNIVGVLTAGSAVKSSVLTLLPDVILLDAYLPDLDGFSITQQLRESWLTPIVLITDNNEILMKALRSGWVGAEAYLIHPFSVAEVKQAIIQAITTHTHHHFGFSTEL